VLPLPWAYLPLGERRSGFLVPRVESSYLTGLALHEPLFITLGQSADLTLTPGWFLGGAGVRGPRLLTELRYAPSEGTAGRALLGALYDLLHPGIALGGQNGLRFEGTVQHAQERVGPGSLSLSRPASCGFLDSFEPRCRSQTVAPM